MIRQEIVLTHTETLLSRAAVQLVQAACKFNSRIRIEQGTKTVNVKSMMGVLSLGGVPKNPITLCVDGDDEQQAMETLVRLISANFADDSTN